MIDSELPQVRIADCGCIIPADAKPIGYRFKATQLGDVRVLVYCCPEHDRTTPRETAKTASKR